MGRTAEQRIQELDQKKQQYSAELEEARMHLETAKNALEERYLPVEEKFKTWAARVHTATPDRAINAREFLGDFFKDLTTLVAQNKRFIEMGSTVIQGWEEWFNGIDAEDMAELEAQLDQALTTRDTMQAS